jgi:hypothetical protein
MINELKTLAAQIKGVEPVLLDETPTFFTNVRNHVYGTFGFTNDVNINFLQQSIDETQYLGVIRINNSNQAIEFFDKSILLKLQKSYESYNQRLTLSQLLNFLFGKKPDEELEFDQNTTIISFMCRKFAETLQQDEVEIMRTTSATSDHVESSQGLYQNEVELPDINTINKNMWLGINIPIKLCNDVTGTI